VEVLSSITSFCLYFGLDDTLVTLHTTLHSLFASAVTLSPAQPTKVVILTKGRFAGKKAVIVRNYDEGTNARPYGHALIAGIQTNPRKITRRMSHKKQQKRSRIKAFIKMVNYNHVMPTRYALDLDLRSVVTPDVVDEASAKKEARKEVKKHFEEKFRTGRNRWFFSPLRM
jgi:large subunit ribosomal protein L27e